MPFANRTLHVTQDHIDQGIQSNCAKCPIALAMQAAFPQMWEVETFAWYSTLSDDQETYWPDHSDQLTEIIKEYDESGQMSPMTLIVSYDRIEVTDA